MRPELPKRVFATLVILLGLPAATWGAGGQEGSYDRIYKLDHLQPRVAEVLVWQLCDELGGDEVCRVRSVTDNGLSVVGPDAFHSAVARMIAEKDTNPRPTQNFLISLVSASRSGEGFDDEIPDPAAAALRDVSSFMPYSRYDLVDSGWLRTSMRGSVMLASTSGMTFDIDLMYQAVQEVDRIELNIGGFEVQRVFSNGERQSLIATSLNMEIGESVVVGTSKPDNQDSALVAVLTALP